MTTQTENSTGRRVGSLRRRPRTARGFTLIEMLIVVGIIALLLAIGLPAGTQIRKAAMHNASQTTIKLVVGACEQYRNDFDEYPDSSSGGGWYGAQMLCLQLTGYVDNPGTTGVPVALRTDDGKDGYGFRIAPRGNIYGPYNNAEKVASENVRWGGGGNHRLFIDAFKHPILYYRRANDSYTTSDNPNSGAVHTPSSITAYVGYYTTDAPPFVLCTHGPDGYWRGAGDNETDDITNMSN